MNDPIYTNLGPLAKQSKMEPYFLIYIQLFNMIC